MGLLLSSAHQVLDFACRKAYQRYIQQANQLELVQRNKLRGFLTQHISQNLSYEQFTKKFPLTRYANWKSKIEQSRSSGKNSLGPGRIVRFQPTSGSSEAIKFIPYTQLFLDELDEAIGLWLCNLYREHPKLKNSTHYWSVSWLPESQRKLLENSNLNDDSALLNVSKRVLSKITQSVPTEIALASSAEDAMFATAVYLVADKHLGMISVWSPTFALQLLDIIQQSKDEIIHVLKYGNWQREGLNFLAVPKSCEQCYKLQQLDLTDASAWKKLWPKLSLISSWDTASAAQWAEQLQQRVDGVAFEGKGLWATEGVVTIPFADRFMLSYQSHFYEFLLQDTNQVVPSWQLKLGDIVSPVITTGSGLIRYVIDDELEVMDFYEQVPCFQFLGRKMTVDLVGEKLDHNAAVQILAQFKQDDYLPISILGIEQCSDKKPHYILLSEGNVDKQPTAQDLDRSLKQYFHYELARDLGQLDEPEVKHVDDAWDYYKTLAMNNGMIEGNIKPEPLKKMKTKII
ncbi:GH3 auxin-responsive promoter [Acinetobacter sp. ANC 5054]|uniref:GH3 family domain-containing protein n=1 Tax=Acinetobacter sp. ANC 5054 TaxID=1977877 RepID=UPI000A330D66|nr:GH3 auxin-responsive promoter family protein [Acinetobacter sp. ANC 5054]OTG82819.1 GH3 auxin-responsive promoter [Acinetobacter sp. ANC 5054]